MYKKIFKRAMLLLLCAVLIISCGCRKIKKENDDSLSDFSDSSFMQSDYIEFSSEISIPESSSETVSEGASGSGSVVTPPSKAPTAHHQTPTKQEIKPSVPVISNPTEIRAVWIAFMELQKILQNKTEKQFTTSIRAYFDQCANYGLNTVIVQVRSHGDAMYRSSIFPTSVYFTGSRQNSAPFDPLTIMVREAHLRGLRIEAWVNPYRGSVVDWSFAPNDPVQNWLGTDKIFTWKPNEYTYYFFNPGEPEVRSMIINGIIEIVQNYDVDGIHMDDYFYPTTDSSIDANTYNNYGNGMGLHEFRVQSVNQMVSAVYREIKARKNITFGISPAGNINHCINGGCADVKLWGSTEGYVDYLAPQIYWSYGEGSLPYEKALADWKAVVNNPKVKLLVGLAPYKVGINDLWSTGNILQRQVVDARNIQNYNGFILFRYEYFFNNNLTNERNNLKAILN